MPLYDFRCSHCGHTEEKLFPSLQAATKNPALCGECHALTVRLPSAPASVVVHGFSAMNGYSSPRKIRMRQGSTKIEVSGNFEAFSDGLHK